MVRLALDRKWKEARKLHLRYLRLFKDMFLDTNPIPVKTAMAMMGLVEEVFRLPLCSMSKHLKVKLRKTLADAGVL
jgi:4-hydroxy-tetrahydrodipicolinate synthase